MRPAWCAWRSSRPRSCGRGASARGNGPGSRRSCRTSPRLWRRASGARAEARPGRAFGRIELPDRGYAALVAEGVDAATLQLAVGHLPGTAFPGERGNVALAGHRDSFFQVLKDLGTNDVLVFRTPDGVFRYRIEWRSVLEPSRTDVIEPAAAEPVLTLVTCYPFGYIGRAPLRYVVRARQIPANPL